MNAYQKELALLFSVKNLIFSDSLELSNEKTKSARLKEKILNLLSSGKALSAEEIGGILGLSRNRVSEYMQELWKEGKVTFFLKGRKKYFMAIKNE